MGGDLDRGPDDEHLRAARCNRLFEGRNERRRGEEAEDTEDSGADVADVMRLHCRNRQHRAGLRKRRLVAHRRLALSFEDQQELLGAVLVHPHVHPGLELEVHGGGTGIPHLTVMWETHSEAPGRIERRLDVLQRERGEIEVPHCGSFRCTVSCNDYCALSSALSSFRDTLLCNDS